MHRCVSVHNAMSVLTSLQLQTSLQHFELGQGRIKRDNDDLRKILHWFELHDPFDIS